MTSRDSLADLERELGIPAHEIAKFNGVPWPGRKTCVWGKDIAAWILDARDDVPGKGGFRRPVSSEQPNNCEPGLGHVSFSDGQVINLPIGARPPAKVAPPTKAKKSNAGLLAFLLAAGAALAASSKGK